MKQDDYILGEDITDEIERVKRPGLVVSARLDHADAARLLALARATNRTVSQVAREAIKLFIAQSESNGRLQVEATWTDGGVVLSPQSGIKSSAPTLDIIVVDERAG